MIWTLEFFSSTYKQTGIFVNIKNFLYNNKKNKNLLLEKCFGAKVLLTKITFESLPINISKIKWKTWIH